MRLFIACALPEGFSDTLAKAQQVLKGQAQFLRLTGMGQLHLTLRFIGETGDGPARLVSAWFKALPGPGLEALQANQGDYGAFPGDRGQIIWSGLMCGDGLRSYAWRLEEGLRGLGFAPERKQWLPHVTLARRAELRLPFEDIAVLLPFYTRAFILGAPILLNSEFTPSGVRYLPV